MKLSLLQRLRLRLFCCVYLRHEKREGWSGELPIYAVNCVKHGLYEDYPHGYSGRFNCPKCEEKHASTVKVYPRRGPD